MIIDKKKKNNNNDKKILDKDKGKHKVIDLRKALEADDDTFICEHCDCRLIPYFDVKGEYITAPGGKLFQCGKCGQIKDTSGVGKYNMKHPEILTSRGDNAQMFITHWRQPQRQQPKPFDIDPGDDATLKGQGFHIVRTRITINGKILRDDYDYS